MKREREGGWGDGVGGGGGGGGRGRKGGRGRGSEGGAELICRKERKTVDREREKGGGRKIGR